MPDHLTAIQCTDVSTVIIITKLKQWTLLVITQNNYCHKTLLGIRVMGRG